MAKKRATLKNSKTDRRADNPGRPPVYNPKFHPQAAKALCTKGATIAEMADAFGVCIATIWNWKAAYSEFNESCKIGTAAADERVERSFYERAVGYTFDTVKIFMPAGAEKPVYAPYREHVRPDPRAGEFWLTNRAPDRWKYKQLLEHDVPTDSPIRILAQQISGNAIRPRMPEPEIIEHDIAEPSAIRPQQYAAAQAPKPITITDGDVIEAELVKREPRIHTVSRESYEADDEA